MPITETGEKRPRIHTVFIYLVDGMPKPSCDALYMKGGDQIRWETAEENWDFKITLRKAGGFIKESENDEIQTRGRENEPSTMTLTAENAEEKYGRYKYDIELILPKKKGPVLDPTIDIGKP